MNISQHITLHEATNSHTAKRLGIDNTPDEHTIINMKIVAEKCFEPARRAMGKPIRVNSFYRCPELNKAVKGSPTSQHVKGEAIDMDMGNVADNKKLYDWCKANLIFDQLINEYNYSWVHISFKLGNNRNEAFAIG